MAGWVQLPKDEVIRCYAFCREAERSVDRALYSSWPLFLAYYTAAKVKTLELLVGRLREKLLPSVARPERSNSNLRSSSSWLSRVFERWGLTRQSVFTLRPDEVQGLIATLDGFLGLLRRNDRPDQEELIGARMALYDRQHDIERRCRGLPELKKAGLIQHWLFPDHLEPVKLEDLLEDPKPQPQSPQAHL
jgi:hypothetical protein